MNYIDQRNLQHYMEHKMAGTRQGCGSAVLLSRDHHFGLVKCPRFPLATMGGLTAGSSITLNLTSWLMGSLVRWHTAATLLLNQTSVKHELGKLLYVVRATHFFQKILCCRNVPQQYFLKKNCVVRRINSHNNIF